MAPPNILYIHSHDTGRYIQPYGANIPTPNLQTLADSGVVFRQAFNAAPTCSPSRAALLTGQAPHSCGQFGLVNRGFLLRDRHKHLAQTLGKAGYYTALAGVHHVARDPLTLGYQEWIKAPDRAAEAVAGSAADFLANSPQQPFFLAVGFFETHREFPEPGAEDNIGQIQPPLPLPDTPETRYDMAAYRASARRLDTGIGMVLEALAENNLADNTLIVCTTDHGLAFPNMKCHLNDHGMGVMLIIKGPGGFEQSQVSDAMVSHLDIYPTICELVGIESPAWLQGKSLLPLVRGEVDEIHDQIAAEVNFHCSYEPKRAIRTKRWKYIRRYADYKFPMLANIDNSPSKTLLMEHGLAERPVAAEALYDLVFDPNEAHNLAADSALSEVLAEMRQRLEAWMQATEDPLLEGPIPPPEGGVVSKPSDVSPTDIWTYTDKPPNYA